MEYLISAPFTVGGKIDVDPVKERKVTYEEAQKRAQEYDLPYLEVSSKESLGIHEVKN